MILYNLKRYLEAEFPAETFIAGSKKNPPDRMVQLIDTGGVPQPWYEFVSESIQCIIKDVSGPKAFELAKQIYEKLKNRYGLILPSATVGTETYPQIQTAQISPNQTPGYIGDDEGGRSTYSVNFRIYY
jgi:hypothetical protein